MHHFIHLWPKNGFRYSQDKYPRHFADMVKNAKPVYGADVVLKAYNIDGDVRIQYRDQADFERIARQFGIFEEWKVISLPSCIYFLFFILKIGTTCLIYGALH